MERQCSHSLIPAKITNSMIEQNRVVTTKKGDELYTHYDKVESSVRERYEKVQKEQRKTTKKKTVTTRKAR